MSKPDDVPQEVWGVATEIWQFGLSMANDRFGGTEVIARAIMAAKAEERQAIEALVSEYVWDDHALEQATNIGLACHHQSLEILEAIRSRT